MSDPVVDDFQDGEPIDIPRLTYNLKIFVNERPLGHTPHSNYVS